MFTIIPPALKGRPHKFVEQGSIRRAVPLTAAEQVELDWLLGEGTALHTVDLFDRAKVVFEAAVAQLPPPVPQTGGYQDIQRYSGGQGWDGLHGDTAEDGGDYYTSREWVFPTKEDKAAYLAAESQWMDSLAKLPTVVAIHAEMDAYGKRRAEYYRRRVALCDAIGDRNVKSETGQELAQSIRDWLGGYFGDGVKHRLRVG